MSAHELTVSRMNALDSNKGLWFYPDQFNSAIFFVFIVYRICVIKFVYDCALAGRHTYLIVPHLVDDGHCLVINAHSRGCEFYYLAGSMRRRRQLLPLANQWIYRFVATSKQRAE